MASYEKCGRTYGGLSAVGTCPECMNPAPLAIPSTSLLAAVLDIEKHWKDMQGPIRDAEHDEDGSMFKGDSYPRLHESFAQMWHAIERAKKAANNSMRVSE